MDGQTCADCRGHGLFNDVHLASPRGITGILHRPLLDASNARWNAHDNARFGQIPTAMHLLDKVTQHTFGSIKVGDNAILQWTNCHNVAGSTSDHFLGFQTDRQDAASILINGDHAGLVEDNAAPTYINQGI